MIFYFSFMSEGLYYMIAFFLSFLFQIYKQQQPKQQHILQKK